MSEQRWRAIQICEVSMTGVPPRCMMHVSSVANAEPYNKTRDETSETRRVLVLTTQWSLEDERVREYRTAAVSRRARGSPRVGPVV